MAILVSLRLHRVILGLRDEIILLGCAASSSKHQRINPRTYMAARGRGWLPLLPPFFFIFSLDGKTSAPTVFSNCSFIPRILRQV